MIPWIPAGRIDTGIFTQSDVFTMANHPTVHVKWQGIPLKLSYSCPNIRGHCFSIYMYSYTYAGKQLHTEGFTQPPVEAVEGKQPTRLMRRQCFMERSNSSFRCYAKGGGERLRSLNNSSNNNINRGTDVVRNCNIIVTMSTQHFVSVT